MLVTKPYETRATRRLLLALPVERGVLYVSLSLYIYIYASLSLYIYIYLICIYIHIYIYEVGDGPPPGAAVPSAGAVRVAIWFGASGVLETLGAPESWRSLGVDTARVENLVYKRGE